AHAVPESRWRALEVTEVVALPAKNCLLFQKIDDGLPERFVQSSETFHRHAFEKELLGKPGKVDIHLAEVALLSFLLWLQLSHALREGLAEPEGAGNWLGGSRFRTAQLLAQAIHGGLVLEKPGSEGNFEMRR